VIHRHTLLGESILQHCFKKKKKKKKKKISTRYHQSVRMENKKIQELIKELKRLQLREAAIVSLIEATNAGRDENEFTHEEGTERHIDATEHGVEKGDRIRIKNQVKKPANWGRDFWEYKQARIATVTFVTVDRIYFVTDNGIRTWRAPHNVERISP
jgi:hypothetical protein